MLYGIFSYFYPVTYILIFTHLDKASLYCDSKSVSIDGNPISKQTERGGKTMQGRFVFYVSSLVLWFLHHYHFGHIQTRTVQGSLFNLLGNLKKMSLPLVWFAFMEHFTEGTKTL